VVGIFHETYKVEAGAHESVYGNMPLFGLAAAMSHVPAVGRRETARRRMGGRLNAREVFIHLPIKGRLASED